jgi:hypothetical protein
MTLAWSTTEIHPNNTKDDERWEQQKDENVNME